MIEFDLFAICEMQRRLDYNDNHDRKGRFAPKDGGDSDKSLKRKNKKRSITHEISARGANVFYVKGFASKQQLNNHWENGRTHKEEYAKEGITTKEQYEQRALELIQMPCGGGVLGYKTSEGKMCRYDTASNDYVTGNPDRGIYTMFKPIEGRKYFDERREQEGIN